MTLPRILLVENERPHIDLIRLAFAELPHQVHLCAVPTLVEARAFLQEHSPDLVIADLHLPDGRGIDLLPEQPDQPALPVVILTAQRDEWAVVEAIKAGAVDYVVKYRETLEELPRIVDRALREWRHINERKLAERALRESEALSRATLEHVLDGVLTMNEAGIIESVNPSVVRIFGYEVQAIEGRHFDTLLAEPCKQIRLLALGRGQAGRSAGGLTREVVGLRRDGTSFPLEVGLSRVQLDQRGLTIATLRDLTRSKRVEQHLTYLAEYDQLTGLPNRVLFGERLAGALREPRAAGHVALLLIDLDGFKMVNDTLGHQAGDCLLSQVAARLRMALGEGDTVARLGGDEFAILLERVARLDDAARVARRILHLVAEPYRLDASDAFVTASIGIAARLTGGVEDGKLLMREADLALYRSKAEGRNAFNFFTPDMHALVQERQQLGTNLRHAIDADAFTLYYQPIIDLASRRIVALEALLRWQHPSQGLITPDRFVPVAEDNGLIVPIGNRALEMAWRQSALWQRQGLLPAMGVAVNLSSRQFLKQHAGELLQICRRNHRELKTVPLTFEITESLLMQDIGFVTSLLQRLKRLGIKVMIDDFGTGFSSLSYLAHLPVDGLKIDRAFLRKMGDDNNTALTRAIIAMARSLNLDVVAEGVETPHQLAQLVGMGCTLAQGFLFGEPVPAATIQAILQEQPLRRPHPCRLPPLGGNGALAGGRSLNA